VKIWDLDKEFDRLIAFVIEGREKRKTSVGGAVEGIRNAGSCLLNIPFWTNPMHESSVDTLMTLST